MWRKILIFNLLLMLAAQPVAQAFAPLAGSAHAGAPVHDPAMMDCGQAGPGYCLDHDNCASGNHGSCDSLAKASSNIPASITVSRGDLYGRCRADRYSSHHTDILLRPPQNA